MKKAVILACFLSLPCSAATAPHFTFFNGNDLYAACTAPDAVSQMQCTSYVEGAIDALAFTDGAFKEAHTICLPRQPGIVSGRQVADIVIKYLRDDPVGRSFSAGSLVYGAISQAYPCAPPSSP
jgi:hypothetical protein